MSKHTPGPWRVEINTAEDADWSEKWPIIVANEYVVVGTEGMYGDIETDMANARLIAAAPETAAERDRLKEINAEMLEALEEFVNVYGVDDVLRWMRVRDKARAAIAKAKGVTK